MSKMWHERRLEIITLSVFILLVLTSLSIFYISYSNYTELEALHSSQAFAHKVIMLISSSILSISLFIVILKRDYFFMESNSNQEGLENLLEEIKYSSDSTKIEEFKKMLKEKNHTEVYSLISNIINELQESKREADEANRAKTLFLSNVSHEIRTPLNGITGFTKILASTKLDGEQQDFVETITKSSEDLLGVVNNILDISKIESSRIELEESEFNIFDEFENLTNLYALEASKKEIDFLFWIDPLFTTMTVKSDAEKIKQVLMNLISNSIKFTKKDGEVVVSIKREALKKGVVSVKFEVTDTGIGMSEEEQSRVFHSFTQADNSNTREYGGAGLGLSISQSWVEMLGGELKLQSVKSKGTTVSFILNLAKKDIVTNEKIKGVNVALYAPTEVQEQKSNHYLSSYLSKVKGLQLEIFKNYVECKEADMKRFDLLYLHYNSIDKEELQRIVAQYIDELPIVLVTKLENRFKILDIAPSFFKIIYEPVTFSKIQIPIKTLLRNSELLSSATPEETLFDLKALVVEDNKINQKMIVHTIKNLGIKSDTAENGEIAVEMVKNSNYDIIFMDIQMPVMNGVVATKKILEYEEKNQLEHTPIVAVTTNALKGDREKYLRVGMDEYIAKPINVHKFIGVIKQFYSTKTSNSNESLSFNSEKILLYRHNPTERKIMSNILRNKNYLVDVAKNRVEFSEMLTKNSYKAVVFDRSKNDSLESAFMDKIYENRVQTLIFIDEESEIFSEDLNAHIHLMYKSADFIDVEEMVEKMMEL